MKRGRTPTRFNSTDTLDLTQPAAARQPTPCAAASLLPKRTQQHHLPLPSQFYYPYPRFLTPLPHALRSCTSVLVPAAKGKASLSWCTTFFSHWPWPLVLERGRNIETICSSPPHHAPSDPRPSNASLAEPPTDRQTKTTGHALAPHRITTPSHKPSEPVHCSQSPTTTGFDDIHRHSRPA